MNNLLEKLENITIKDDLFKNVTYISTGEIQQKVIQLLEKGGASTAKYMIANQFTHLICGKNFSEDTINEATDLYEVPVVNESWVIASSLLGHLTTLKPYHPLDGKLFANYIAVIVNVSLKDRKSLFALIAYNGGAVRKNFDASVNLVVCGSAKGPVYSKALQLKNGIQIVTPDWVSNSFKNKTILSPLNFHPRLVLVPPKPAPQMAARQNSDSGSSLKSIIGFDANETDNGAQKMSQQMTSQISAVSKPIQANPMSKVVIINNQPAPPQQQQFHQISQQNKIILQQQNIQIQKSDHSIQMQSINPNLMHHSTNIMATHQQQQASQQHMQRQLQQSESVTPDNNQMGQQAGQMIIQQNPNSTIIVNQPHQAQQQQQQQQQQQHSMVTTQKFIVATSTTPSSSSSVASSTSSSGGQQTQIIQNHMLSQQQKQHIIQNLMLNQQNANKPGGGGPTQIQIIQTSKPPGGGQQQQQGGIQQLQQQQQSMSGGNQPQIKSTMIIHNQQLNPAQQANVMQQIVHQQQINKPMSKQIVLNAQGPASSQQQQQQQIVLINPNVQQSSGGGPNQQHTIIQQGGQGQQIISNQQQQQQMNSGGHMLNQMSQQIVGSQHQLTQQQQAMQQMNYQLAQQQQKIISQQQAQQQQQQQQQQILNQGNVGVVQQQISQDGQPVIIQNQQIIQQQQQQPPQQIVVQQQQQQQQQNQQQPGGGGVQMMQQTQVSQSPQHIQSGGQVIQTNQVLQQQQQQQQQNPQQQQQWTPQSPVHGMPQQQQQGQQVVVQQQMPAGQQQFIRATRPGWVTGPQGAQRQVHQVHVDAQTHNRLQQLDPMQRALYISKIQKQRNIIYRPQVAYQGRPGAPGQNIVGAPRPGTQLIIRSQVPPNLIQQQQVQLLQQQGGRPILVRPGTAPGLSPISQQVGQAGGVNQVVGQPPQQFPIDPNATPQQQQQQILIQRQQQYRLQQIQLQRDQAKAMASQQQQQGGQAVSPRGFNPDGTEIINSTVVQQQTSQANASIPQSPIAGGPQTQILVQDANQAQNSMNAKTKTALANMLSNRLNNNGVVVPQPDQVNNPAVVNTEPSAAGTLRLMTQQHNAALNPVVRTPQEMAALQQQQNQRRTLGNITNNSAMGPQVVVPGGNSTGIILPQTPPGAPQKGPFSPGRAAPIQRSQFYGHNPNLKLPLELFLLGCIFFIVEYDESNATELDDWKELIRKHGGEIESCYCAKVTHVLCKTQRHGVVMQAIRDSKRCVTAYWLNDTIIKKQVNPPWQALHLPSPSTFGTQKPATRHIISITGFDGEERNRLKLMVTESGAKLTEYLSKHNTVLICKRLDGSKYRFAKENNIPVVNVSWLSDILLGNLSVMSQYESTKYQQYNMQGIFRIDYALVVLLMTAWKSPINLTQESHERVKRSLQEGSPAIKPKRVRTLPPLEDIPDEIVCSEQPDPNDVPRIIFSQVDNLEGLKKAVSALGGIVVEEPAQATHLVMTRLTRTIKLLTCLCCVKYIASSDWIVESARSGKFLSPDNFTIQDTNFERQFEVDIFKTVKSPNRNRLFEGKVFYLTPSIFPAMSTIAQLIELSGGVIEKVRRSAARIQEGIKQSPGCYIIISCFKDFHLVADVSKIPKSNQMICTTEVIMKSVMTQTMNFDETTINVI